MIPRRIAGANRTFTAPLGWRNDDPSIADLAVRVSNISPELQVFATAWEPTPAELAALNAGGSIILNLVGYQNPVSLHVEDLETGKEIAG